MRLQRMLGHLPALFIPSRESVLVVGCGAGVTAGSFALHPGIEAHRDLRNRAADSRRSRRNISRRKITTSSTIRRSRSSTTTRGITSLTTSEKFDIITSDPIHPWVKGAATLYTQEYFELVKQQLNPGGIVTQWVPLYRKRHQTW